MRVKSGLAALLMLEAQLLATRCVEIEESEKDLDWPQPHFEESTGHAAAVVLLATSALEAAINEIYLHAVDGNVNAFPSLTEQDVTLLGQMWDPLEASRAPVLRKFSVALVVARRTPMVPGKEPTQSCSVLIALRDLIVHFKPEWEDELDKHLKLEKQLRSKFTLNQLPLEHQATCCGSQGNVWAQDVRNGHAEWR